MNYDNNYVELFMMKINKRMREGFASVLEEYGLSKIHFRYIITLQKNTSGLTLKELSEQLCLIALTQLERLMIS